MFGSIRLLLAISVALSHVGITVFGLNPGPIAVVSFYLISGYVTAGLLDKQLVRPVDYYSERALRLLPGYWMALGLAAVIWLAVPQPNNIYFLQRIPGWTDWLSNLVIVPLNFYMWSGQDHFTLIPPAWSLAAEFQFYALAPWILRLPRGNGFAIIIASLGIWLVAQIGLLQSDWWGYRLLPGVLFMFLSGTFIYRAEKAVPIGIWIVAMIVFVAAKMSLVEIQPFNVETSVGLLLGIPMLMWLSQLPRRRWDDFIGRLAYPMFLLHFPMMWAFEKFGYAPAYMVRTPQILAMLIGCTLVASQALFLLTEAPLMRLRHSLRQHSLSKHAFLPWRRWSRPMHSSAQTSD
jgi:peptidoglycan/LPS O-acetylase OafA/YrhL